MASSKKTDNLNLTQYVGTDKPSWLNDYNTDMKQIDDHAGAVNAALANITAQVEQNVLQRMYPIGSVYCSFSNTDPAQILGFGTWASAFVGRSPMGVDPADTDFSTGGKTGGTKRVILTKEMIPSHAHKIPALEGDARDSGDHTHNTSGEAESTGSHFHTGPNHTHSGPSHTHKIPKLSGQTNLTGNHSHTLSLDAAQGYNGGNAYTMGPKTVTISQFYTIGKSGEHSHSVTIDENTSHAAGIETTGSGGTGNTGDSGVHNHVVKGTAAIAGKHSHIVDTEPSVTGSIGDGVAHDNMHPYETAYFWKRIA